jgi:hypothetical protein
MRRQNSRRRGEVECLVEACDLCEADEYAYSNQSVTVSDLLTPHFYDPEVAPETRYSFTEALKVAGRHSREVTPIRRRMWTWVLVSGFSRVVFLARLAGTLRDQLGEKRPMLYDRLCDRVGRLGSFVT